MVSARKPRPVLEEQLRSLVSAGRRNEAISLYRQQTGSGLMEATAAVAAISRQRGITQRESDSVEWDVISLLERGLTDQAVDFYRERTGCGTREAGDAVERLAADRGIPLRGARGCLSVVGLGILGIVIVLAFAPDGDARAMSEQHSLYGPFSSIQEMA